MADNERRIRGTVSIEKEDGCRERVAFELMKFIRGGDTASQDSALELYQRCLAASIDPNETVADIKARIGKK